MDRVGDVTRPAHFIIPDRIYLVDVPAAVTLERRAARGGERNALYEPELLDQVEAQCKAYRELHAHFASSLALDGTRPLDANLQRMWKDLGLPGEPQP